MIKILASSDFKTSNFTLCLHSCAHHVQPPTFNSFFHFFFSLLPNLVSLEDYSRFVITDVQVTHTHQSKPDLVTSGPFIECQFKAVQSTNWHIVLLKVVSSQKAFHDGSNLHTRVQKHYKSVNLQYNTLVCWANGTNVSWTKRLMFQVLFYFFHRILQNSQQKKFQFFFSFFI